MNFSRSKELFAKANQVMVGGVNSPVRAFKGVGGEPFFVASGAGARIKDVDGNEYVDYVLSWGPLVHGHAHPRVVEAVCDAMGKGASFGIPTEAEVRIAERIIEIVPSIEKVRLVNSGTEASMSAIRLARGHTNRDLIVKVEGGYHGHVDGLLSKAGSGLTTLGVPTSPGIPEAYAACTLTIPYNDLEAARRVFEKHGKKIAGVVVEPVAGNMGVVTPVPNYLDGMRELTVKYGSLLIFDEVMTGFRVALGGAQSRYRVLPDLTILGKVIGGGLPVGAYGGPHDIMDKVSPTGPIYQAGTLSGNPLATAAGLATLDVLEEPGVVKRIEDTMKTLCDGLGEIAREAGIPVYQTRAGSMACMFFHDGPITNYTEATTSDTKRYAKFFWGMLERGVYLAPSQFEAAFMSSVHTERDIDQTLAAAREVFATL